MLLRLLNSMDRDKFVPILISQKEDAVTNTARDQGIFVKIIPFRGILNTYNKNLISLNPGVFIPTIIRLLQFNTKVKPILDQVDIIWCQNLRAVLTLVPSIINSRNSVLWNIGLGMESTGVVKYLNSVALEVVDHVYIESKHQAKSIFTGSQYKRHKDKFHVFHKGIDIDKFNPDVSNKQRNKKYRVGTAGTFTPRKGFEDFILIANEILKSRSDVEFLIAGEAPNAQNQMYENKILDIVDNFELNGRVKHLGWVENMPNYYNELDVFVLPSRNEGISGAVREAMAMKVPVVITCVGGHKDLVENKRTGYLVEPGDTDQMVRHIESLLDDPHLRMQMGKNARELIKNEFSLQNYVRKYEELLMDIVENDKMNRS